MGSEFDTDTDTAVRRGGDDLFRARITDRWNTFAGPNGGYVLATAVRALAEIAPMPHPFAVTGHFLRPPRPGDAEIGTELIKAGRRHATAHARLSQDGKDVLVVLATFADLATAKGREVVFNEPPSLPAPDAAIDPLGALDAAVIPPIAHRMDLRVAEMPGFVEGRPSGRPEFSAWMRVTGGDGWLAMRVRTRHVIRGYHEEDAELWDSTGSLVAQSRQLALLGG